jgi:16S rRNA C967 or C1407 C5-methylase (RsmB/RsmF family)
MSEQPPLSVSTKYPVNGMEAEFSPLPAGFAQELTARFGAEQAERILHVLNNPAGISLRLHPQKPFLPNEAKGPFAHFEFGYSLKDRPVFTLDPAFHAGGYYVQEAASMLLNAVMQQLEKPRRVLDLCAAPGGKSLLALDFLQEQGWLWSNEVNVKRFSALQENLERWAMPQVVCSQRNPAYLANLLAENYDWVVVDAPCSGEGMFRKDNFARTQWSHALGIQCAGMQQELLEYARKLTSPGGYLIYSTCTMNPAENEWQMKQSLQAFGWECVPLEFPESWGLVEDSLRFGFYSFPGIGPGEGFYFSVWRKPGGGEVRGVKRSDSVIYEFPGGWNWKGRSDLQLDAKGDSVFLIHPEAADYARMAGQHVDYIGIKISEAGVMQHGAAFLPGLSGERIFELDKTKSLEFLQGQALPGQSDLERGQFLMRWSGLGLGWAKHIGSRFNNLVPKGRRIRIRFP